VCNVCQNGTCQLCLASSDAAKSNTTVHEDGGVSCVGRESVARFRALTLRSALSLQAKGFKLSRGVSALKIARTQYGIKAKTAAAALVELDRVLAERGV
jgi:hypothetical protein